MIRPLPVQATRIEELEALQSRYTEIPMEAILKQDILRLGLDFDQAALSQGEFKEKDYFIFSFDHVPLEAQSREVRFRAPEEIRITGGHFGLLPTIVSVRINPESPYRIHPHEGQVGLFLKEAPEEGTAAFSAANSGETFLGFLEFPPVPAYYKNKTRSGKPVGEIAPVIEWGYLIYLTVFRNCQYFGKTEECAFCDINHNYRQQKNQGRPYTGVKPLEDILEVLTFIDQEDSAARVYTITGGSVTKSLRGKEEVDFYYEYAEGIERAFPGRWMGKMVTQAWEKGDLERFRDVGIRVYHPNYEVWDKRLFEVLCPGKARFIGRENWIRRIVESAEVFGPSHVIPNFVGGVELSRPYGFSTIEDAIASTAEGLDFFMSHGVVPRFTTWCPEPYTTLAEEATQEHPPLAYFCELLTVWKRTFEKYKLPVPPGYGEPGPGKAVFSVSAFMDVIGYEGR